MISTEALDKQLAFMRTHNRGDVVLVGCALAPEHVRWAQDNDVGWLQSALVMRGVLYLMNRESLPLLESNG